MQDYPQVALFGSIGGEWREEQVIPLLEKLNVTYYDPSDLEGTWTQVHGTREADVTTGKNPCPIVQTPPRGDGPGPEAIDKDGIQPVVVIDIPQRHIDRRHKT